MAVDLKWHDAMVDAKWTVRGVQGCWFDAMEYAAGWPEKMTPHQLAALQRPWISGDMTSKRRLEALLNAIKSACVAGELPNEQREVVKTSYQFQILYVTAAAFAEWLRTQGEEPSQHIANWFKVRGVTAPKALQLAPPVPTFDVVAKLTEAVPAYGEVGKPAEVSDAKTAWLTAKNYNVAWLLSERSRFKELHGERGHYMKKLVAYLKTLGVDVPGKDPAREIRRLEGAAPGKTVKKEAATFVSGLVGRKSGGT